MTYHSNRKHYIDSSSTESYITRINKPSYYYLWFILFLFLAVSLVITSCSHKSTKQRYLEAVSSPNNYTYILGGLNLGLDRIGLYDWYNKHQDTTKPFFVTEYDNINEGNVVGVIKTKNYRFFTVWTPHFNPGSSDIFTIYIFLNRTYPLKPNVSITPKEDFTNLLENYYGPLLATDTSLGYKFEDSFFLKDNMHVSYNYSAKYNSINITFSNVKPLWDKIQETVQEINRRSNLSPNQFLAEEAEEKFYLARDAQNYNDMYIQAGLAAHFYLEAKDYENYKKWSDVENQLKYQVRY